MEQQEIDKTTRIEELKTFPFKTFQEYKKASFEGLAQPTVDRSVAFKWARNGIYAPKLLRFQTTMLTLLPFFALIGFIIYIIVAHNWWFLLTLPLLIVAFFVFHPSSAILLKPIRNLIIGLIIIGFAWAAWSGKDGLLTLTISLIIIWFAQNSVYRTVVHALINAANQHEDLFCKLWNGKVLSIKFYNGDTHAVDHKFENGNLTSYKY